MMTETINVIMIEDNAEYRAAVSLALGSTPDIRLTGQYQTAEAGIRELEKKEKSPHVILLDIRLPGMTGIEAIERILKPCPDAKILILTQSSQEPDVVQAIASGAFGYLLKSTSSNELISAIRNAFNGDATIDSGVAKYLLELLRQKSKIPANKSLLSDREREVISLLAEGLLKKEIAAKLHISYTTVDTHVSRIYSKLGVNNAPAAVNRAHKLSLLPQN